MAHDERLIKDLGFVSTTLLPPTPPDTEENVSDLSNDVAFPLPPPSRQPEILEIDKKTPDHHVPRDPRLIRLTGVHPFNVEPPLTELYGQGIHLGFLLGKILRVTDQRLPGFLTPPELWYVRNHGAVPEVQDDETLDWEFSVEGRVLSVVVMVD